jgi:aspartyl-tRNA synthetase
MPIERTTSCGLINEQWLSNRISLAGWVHRRRDHGGLIFVDLRDRTGLMQLVFNPDINAASHTIAHDLRSEYVIAVSGTVINRQEKTINTNLPTGRWELTVDHLEILNTSKTPPFALDDAQEIDEEVRLTYRYLDLRRPEMHAKFALRNKAIFAAREFLQKEDFY